MEEGIVTVRRVTQGSNKIVMYASSLNKVKKAVADGRVSTPVDGSLVVSRVPLNTPNPSGKRLASYTSWKGWKHV